MAKILFIISVNNFIEIVLPNVISFISIVIYTSVIDTPLLPAYVILLISYYHNLCQTFGYDFMRAVTYTINAVISFKRVEVSSSTYFKFCDENLNLNLRHIFFNLRLTQNKF